MHWFSRNVVFPDVSARAYARGGLGLKPLLTLIFYKHFITCAKEI